MQQSQEKRHAYQALIKQGFSPSSKREGSKHIPEIQFKDTYNSQSQGFTFSIRTI